MRDNKLKNLAGLFRNSRTRTIIIFTGVVLGFMLLVGILHLMNRGTGPEASAQVGAPSSNLQSIPGGFGRTQTEEYARLQQQQNASQAKSAEKRGGSAIPTIIQASSFQQETPAAASPCCQPCGCQTGVQGKGLPLGLASALSPGTLVFDKDGNVIGVIGPDGKVRDASGGIIGTVGPDGLVRDLNGNVIGAASQVVAGMPVYDAQGRLIGIVGPDGKVRDAKGNVIGTVAPDGTVRDLNGNVIGHTSKVIAGTPVYDAQGRLIGTVGDDGKVRDADGKIIGTLGADGVVRDANGNVIGKTGALSTAPTPVAGTPVYDAQGRLIGTVGPDGKVRDANGNVIGTVGPDGVVRDTNGKVIGKAGMAVVGTPVYDSNGKLIGTVGPNGQVLDSNGNVIGKVGPDGTVRNLSGAVIGKTGTTIQGTPIYDAQGRLIGIAGPDGNVRDAAGHVIGKVGLDGVVRDEDGNVLGNTTAPGTTPPTALGVQPTDAAIPGNAALPGGENSQLQAAIQRQEQLVTQQRADQIQQQLQAAMTAQAGQLVAAWQPTTQAYVAGDNSTSGTGSGAGGNASGAAGLSRGTAGQPPAVKAGTVMFSILVTAVNSDEPGPVLAKIVEGKFKGGQLLGTLTNQGETVLLTFNTLSLPNLSQSISINAVAIDQNTARTAFSSYTNNHYMVRYGTLFAASFLQGYAQALTQSGTTVSSTGLATSTAYPNLSPAGKFMVALGNVGTQYSSRLNAIFNTPPTVHVNSGAAMGILFLTDVPALPTS